MKLERNVLCAPVLLVLVFFLCGCKAQPDEARVADNVPTHSRMEVASPSTTELDTRQAAGGTPLNCFGDWRIAIEELEGGSLDPVPVESWCRSTPQVLSIKFHRDSEGRPTVVGDPLKPSDVAVGYGICEFQFEGPTPGVPENYTFIVEVPSDAASPGHAKCTGWGPMEEGRRAGIGLTRTAHATRSGSN